MKAEKSPLPYIAFNSTCLRLGHPLIKHEALIIDDIGYVLQGWEEMKVPFTLLANHYEHGSLEADLAKAEPVNSIGIQANDEVKALAR
jgi:hypothetical protein